jgi:hypothetical protein
MRIVVDKIASSARHVVGGPWVTVGPRVPARSGTVVVGRVLDTKSVYNQLEDAVGRLRTVHAGDIVVGVLGARGALRGYAGEVPDRVDVGDHLHLLNLGGVVGRCTSFDAAVGPPARFEVLGAVQVDGQSASILPGPVAWRDDLPALPPMVILAGTCMHAGKTAAACAVVRGAASRGIKVGAAKLTGVALRRDGLDMEDHGAEVALTFADAGLPSTCGQDVVQAAKGVLAAVAAYNVGLIVAELGDGLLGSYGVRDLLVDPEIRAATGALVLSAPDPVAAWGAAALLAPWGHRPTVITGPATDNESGISAIREHVGLDAINARRDPMGLADHVLAALGIAVGIRGAA